MASRFVALGSNSFLCTKSTEYFSIIDLIIVKKTAFCWKKTLIGACDPVRAKQKLSGD